MTEERVLGKGLRTITSEIKQSSAKLRKNMNALFDCRDIEKERERAESVKLYAERNLRRTEDGPKKVALETMIHKININIAELQHEA